MDTQDYLAPETIGGVDLYAYGLNNPIMYVDPTGHFWEDISNWFSNTGRAINDWFTTAGNSIETFIKNVIEDVINYNIDNTNEQAVINAHYVSAYKGTFVLKLPIGINAFSFGIIVFGMDIDNNTVSDPTTIVKHEYGHKLQLEEKGWLNYIFEVAIPSVTGYILSNQKKLPCNYYALPWEYEADAYGNVNRGVEEEKDMNFWKLISYFFR